jgi:hypothetical protein
MNVPVASAGQDTYAYIRLLLFVSIGRLERLTQPRNTKRLVHPFKKINTGKMMRRSIARACDLAACEQYSAHLGFSARPNPISIIHSFIHSFYLLGFSRVFRSFARLADLANSRRIAATLFRAAPRHPQKQEPCVPSGLLFPLNHYLNRLGLPSR